MDDRLSLRAALALSAVAALGAGPAVFVALGGVDQARLADDTWDYAVDPPDLSGLQEALLGVIGGLLVAGAVTGVWAIHTRTGAWRPSADVVGLVAAAAAWIGLVVWVGVQPVSGANIGFGMAVMLSVALVPGLVIAALGRARRVY